MHQQVQRPLHSPGRVTPEPRSAAGGVHATVRPFGQRAGGAAPASRLPHRLLAPVRQATGGQLLLRADGAADGLVRQAQRGQRQDTAQRPHSPGGRSSTQHGTWDRESYGTSLPPRGADNHIQPSAGWREERFCSSGLSIRDTMPLLCCHFAPDSISLR